jgi:Uma2 family endonuclease
MESTLDLPVVKDQHAFNLKRWAEACAAPVLASYEFRVETDRYGHPIMMPPPGFDHSAHQSEIAIQLHALMRGGKVLAECPVSTSEGVKGVDVVWISTGRIPKARRKNVLVQAPEICVEVISPGNTRGEIEEKKRLYFASGAEEVWLCDVKGHLAFYRKSEPAKANGRSILCPKFPAVLAD